MMQENNTAGVDPDSWREAVWKNGMKMKAASCWIQSRQTWCSSSMISRTRCSPGMETTWWPGEDTPRDVLTGTHAPGNAGQM
jgi:hypothetical protein